MRHHSLAPWQHSHNYGGDSAHAERSTTRVMVLTAAMMVVEIVAGIAFGSMALLADGWHMATHVAAFGIAVFAYRFARSHADNPRFSFGTGKVGVLAGFASGVGLSVVALLMASESVMRVFSPHAIRFDEAIGIAVLGLVVNLVCGAVLHADAGQGHSHGHGPGDPAHEHPEHEHYHDHNLRAAYLHVVADALTSVFAIVALVAGKYLGWVWLDPVMGLVGAAVIVRWSLVLIGDTSAILLDGATDDRVRLSIRQAIEADADNSVADLHVWQLGSNRYSVCVSVVTHRPNAPAHYKRLLADIPNLVHVIVEVNCCDDASCVK